MPTFWPFIYSIFAAISFKSLSCKASALSYFFKVSLMSTNRGSISSILYMASDTFWLFSLTSRLTYSRLPASSNFSYSLCYSIFLSINSYVAIACFNCFSYINFINKFGAYKIVDSLKLNVKNRDLALYLLLKVLCFHKQSLNIGISLSFL